jgi:membrane-associated phospholipid phosphatase
VRRKLSIRVTLAMLGCMGTLGSLTVAQSGVAAARPQEPEVDGGASKVPAKEQETKKAPAPIAADPDWTPSHHGFAGLGKDFLEDQKQIWTSPARLRFPDADWLVPAGGFAAGLFVTDRDFSTHLSNNPSTISHYKTISTAGIGALVGGAAGLWVLSYPAHNERWRETGFLAGEAAINSLVAVEGMKYTLRRERPFQGDGSGPFFHGGTSFPSEHAAAAWSVAGVIAHEYPGVLPRIAAYGLATLVSYSRVKGKQHFPSDVFIGGMIGQLIAQDVYSRRHDPGLGGAEWRSIGEIVRGDRDGSPASLGSPYVPLDSWVYPALERLAGLGMMDSGFAGMRPWTRGECARLVNEAADHVPNDDRENSQAMGLLEALQREFQPENGEGDGDGSGAFRVESLYSRTEHISGTPLNDGFHFAQTQINDFGRPYEEGWSTVNGASAYTTWGRWVGYVRGEWQAAPGAPAFPLAARETIERVDRLGQLPPGTANPSTSQFELLDAYVGLMLSNWQITFGRQSLWWGPGEGGALMFSDNAAPLDMFRINRVTPFKLPSVFGWLGPLRLELFLGQLRGQTFIFGEATGNVGTFGTPLRPQPMIHGERFTFKPTENFEFGFSRTGLFAGTGVPFTLHTLEKSFFGTGNGLPGTSLDPGDRRSGLDWSYRVPRLRNWLTFYGDAFTDDQISPITYMDRSAISAGLYLSHVPGVPKLDLRVEGTYTDVPAGGNICCGFFYANDRYLNGYTSNGNLLASWIGRDGQGAQAWTNYWFNARNRLQFSYRHQKVSQQFIPGGGTLTDAGVRGDYWVRPSLSVSASVQYERWLFPVIQPNGATNVSARVEVSFQPQKLFRHSVSGAVESGLGSGER